MESGLQKGASLVYPVLENDLEKRLGTPQVESDADNLLREIITPVIFGVRGAVSNIVNSPEKDSLSLDLSIQSFQTETEILKDQADQIIIKFSALDDKVSRVFIKALFSNILRFKRFSSYLQEHEAFSVSQIIKLSPSIFSKIIKYEQEIIGDLILLEDRSFINACLILLKDLKKASKR